MYSFPDNLRKPSCDQERKKKVSRSKTATLFLSHSYIYPFWTVTFQFNLVLGTPAPNLTKTVNPFKLIQTVKSFGYFGFNCLTETSLISDLIQKACAKLGSPTQTDISLDFREVKKARWDSYRCFIDPQNKMNDAQTQPQVRKQIKVMPN